MDSKMFAPLTPNAIVRAPNESGQSSDRNEWFPIVPPPEDAEPPPSAHPKFGVPTETYDYRDNDGNRLYFRCRFDTPSGKEIWPCTYGVRNGKRGWHWKAPVGAMTLYGLERFADLAGRPVVVVEGEKTANAARKLFEQVIVVTSPMGSNAAKNSDWSPLAGRDTYVWPDADEPGLAYAEDVAQLALEIEATSVRILKLDLMPSLRIEPGDLPKGWDAADAVAEGHPADWGAKLLADDTLWRRAEQESTEPIDLNGKPSQRDKVVEVGMEAELWQDDDEHGYATVTVRDHSENHRIKGRGFKSWLLRRYGRRFPILTSKGRRPSAPSSQSLIQGIAALEAMAIDGEVFQPWVRIAKSAERIYLDLGSPDWSAVDIRPSGWKVVSEPDTRFIRLMGMRMLPRPRAGGDISRLRKFVNVGSYEDFQLLVGWLVGALSPKGPYPVLVVNGEQGSAKSTLCKGVRRLVDPNHAEVRSAPRDERDLVIAASNGYLICLDNLSHLSPALSDAMCRVATGTGFGTRKLYTDTDETLIRVCRPQIINGIPDLATRPDLLDRSIVLTLPVIPDEGRRSEEDFWREFESEAPYILGALLDAVSCALERRSSVRLDRLPRMADFAQWVEAAAPALGWKPGEFVEIFQNNRAQAVHASFDADAVAQMLHRFAEVNAPWVGTATELRTALGQLAQECRVKDKSWPKTASHLSGCIRMSVPTLRRLGVRIEFDRTGSGRSIHIDFAPKTASSPSSSASSACKSLKSQGDARDGDVTADDGARRPAVIATSVKNKDRDGDDADDGVLTANSKWGMEV